MNPNDRTDPTVIAALARRCKLCGAPPGQDCRNTCAWRVELPGRVVHHYRMEDGL